MRQKLSIIAFLPACLAISSALAVGTTYRLYDGITAFVVNPDGRDFTLTLDVRDINHRMHGPSELLVKVYPPDGKPVVREIIADDGVLAHTSAPAAAGWDHEAWYYATCYSRGLEPLVRWSAFSDTQRIAAMQKRTFTYQIKGGAPGVYRILLAGGPDHYVTLALDPDLKYGVAGNPEWLHGHGELYRRSFIYVPKTTTSINLLFQQLDEPATRSFTLKDSDGATLASGNGWDGLVQTAVKCEGKRDEQIFSLEVSEGEDDYLVNVTFQMDNEFKPVRASFQAVTAVFAPDRETAKAIQGGAIYHDGNVFWQMHQVRLYDWLKRLKPEDFEYPKELNDTSGFISVGSHNSPSFGTDKARAVAASDLIMHGWNKHKNPQALNAAIKDMLFGLRLIGHGDHVAIGPLRNLSYEMGCYTFFWWRPAWRIIRQSDAPQEVKDILREFVIQGGDRLVFCRTMETGNGNAFGSLMAAVRYCVEASEDPLQKQMFDTIWERFTTGGYGERVGIGPSGGLQESFGYDYHYGSYVVKGWHAIINDLQDPRFIEAHKRMLNLYSYIWFPESGGNPWSSRTSLTGLCGGSYDSWDQNFPWKGFGGPSFTTGVNGHNEWFAARRDGYYMVTYHGRLTPTWEGEGFHGQIGLGGGAICQLHIIGKGQVLSSKPNDSYGSGMHLSQWRNFHVHSLVGVLADGKPLVAANSEHFNAKIEGNKVTSSGPARESSVEVFRAYEYGQTAIACEVRLKEAIHDNVFALWGGRPALRGKVTEAYEMIPFVDGPKHKEGKRGEKGRTKVSAIGTSGEMLAELTDESVGGSATAAAGVLIDRGGYGVMIQFDQTRPVLRGQNDTVLIQLASGLTPASDIALKYHIVPFQGEPPRIGELAGGGKEEHLIAKIDGAVSLDKAGEALANVAPLEIKDGQKVIAALRFGVAGDCLALSADVTDKNVTRQDVVWRGSCIEVFGSKPAKYEIGQVFLAPAAGDKPACGYRAQGNEQLPDSSILVKSEPAETGYKLQALVPLSLLKLDAGEGKFLLEFQVGADHGGKGIAHKTLFDSKRAYEFNTDYGLFVFNRSEGAKARSDKGTKHENLP